MLKYNASLVRTCNLEQEKNALYYLDLIFLSIFIFEIMLRLLGYGLSFLRDPLQAIDFVVVTIAFITRVLPDSVMAGSGNMINLLRVIRLFRLAVVLQRLQRSRDAAAMRRKRAMYRRSGAPVEKVLAFLTDLRARLTLTRDQSNIDWMMEVICAEDLYSVAEFDENMLAGMSGASGGGAADMSRYLSSETGLARRRAGSFNEGENEGESLIEMTLAKGDGGSMGRRKMSDASLNLWAGAAIATTSISIPLAKLVSTEGWMFDIFEYNHVCAQLPEPATGKAATLLCYYLLEQRGVLDQLHIDRGKMLAWLDAIEKAYSTTNPYHNALHAADVCANMDYFMRQPNLARQLRPLDELAGLVAALMHDMEHPGVNNTFLEATRNELAIVYNDVSVLENHHVAAAFKLLKVAEYDWTDALTQEDPNVYKDFRETVVQMVLGTDMRAHFEHLTKFKSKLAGDGFAATPEKPEKAGGKDVRLLLTMALHAADIANPAKPQPLATAWARRSMDEFFQQGDREAELGIPVSPFMDRSKVPLASTIVNCQIGFINVLVRPLLSEWAAFLGSEAERDVIVTLEATLRLWETSGAKVIDSWGDFATVKAPAALPEVTSDAKADAKASAKMAKGAQKDKEASKPGSKVGAAGSSQRL